MKTMQIKDLFQVTSGNKLDFGKMATTENGVAFVSRSSRNNGVVGYIEKIGNVSPFESGLITVSLGGTYVLSSFVQPTEFYTAQNVAVLRPLVEMSIQEKLFYCMCISANRFRYSAFGREANRTLKYLEVPTREEIPEWVSSATIPDYSHIKKVTHSANSILIQFLMGSLGFVSYLILNTLNLWCTRIQRLKKVV